ncbi:hypothetical protein A4R29_14355 [Mesorhizobium ciceri biovar biserrulae]|nr:hypothetical protein A4R29_14355 [Mesorhizobium ciceri biovar biserrulae]
MDGRLFILVGVGQRSLVRKRFRFGFLDRLRLPCWRRHGHIAIWVWLSWLWHLTVSVQSEQLVRRGMVPGRIQPSRSLRPQGRRTLVRPRMPAQKLQIVRNRSDFRAVVVEIDQGEA